ncbi:DNL-type zinc finger protein [Aspergillus puulaauensis]|uniref:DNL-type domain-containing protein n=1 Tax=Aspergillus puulaauensis TaxID=1220207 RepID=A0A7R7XLZ9_9EURO|nr:uncharacterized protein APUU_40419S [Aspergillus puulaauensis]BCS23975.1 hypothetical protein APUU_40419S [Aspergillus puulaauensis]
MHQSLRVSQGLRAAHRAFPRLSVPGGAPRLYSQLSCHHRPSLLRSLPSRSRIAIPSINIRYNSSSSDSSGSSDSSDSSTSNSAPLTDRQSNPKTDAENAEQNRLRREQEPAYRLTFTCRPCGERSSHRVSKHGYHRGTTLIRCPSCENRHVISDHLGIFFDRKRTLEDLLEERGQSITRGELQGDMEFWDDGTVTRKEYDNDTHQARII